MIVKKYIVSCRLLHPLQRMAGTDMALKLDKNCAMFFKF